MWKIPAFNCSYRYLVFLTLASKNTVLLVGCPCRMLRNIITSITCFSFCLESSSPLPVSLTHFFFSLYSNITFPVRSFLDNLKYHPFPMLSILLYFHPSSWWWGWACYFFKASPSLLVNSKGVCCWLIIFFSKSYYVFYFLFYLLSHLPSACNSLFRALPHLWHLEQCLICGRISVNTCWMDTSVWLGSVYLLLCFLCSTDSSLWGNHTDLPGAVW